jgi:hypothetical protein
MDTTQNRSIIADRIGGDDFGNAAFQAALAANENAGDLRAEVPSTQLVASLGNANEHRHLLHSVINTNRDVLSTSAQTRVEAKDNTQAILSAIAASSLANAERESRELRDRIAALQAAATVASNNNGALIAQIGGMMNTAISTITNIVQTGTGDVSLAL